MKGPWLWVAVAVFAVLGLVCPPFLAGVAALVLATLLKDV